MKMKIIKRESENAGANCQGRQGRLPGK